MTQSDIEDVIKIHKKSFVGFFLTRMGANFLRIYYQSALDFKDSITLVAYDDINKRNIGFAVGFRKPEEFYEFFKKRRKYLIPTMLLRLIRNPSMITAIIENSKRIERNSQHKMNEIELSSIASEERGKDVGRELLKEFIIQAALGPDKRIVLTTDADENDSVRRFYEKNGFTLKGYESRGKRKLCIYVFGLE